MKKAIVTGITGQDGAYLAELLLAKGYEVWGTFRRTSTLNLWRIEYLNLIGHPNLNLVECDITDISGLVRLLSKVGPDEVYNLAAQSFVGASFEQPLMTTEITGIGALNIVEAIRIVSTSIKYYQASTSELFGLVQEVPQSELTSFYPRSPYGVAKLYAHWITINYRESYGLFGSCGILFNHESPLRGSEFVTRKISDGVAKIHLGLIDRIELGNLDSKRDWGYAKDYVEGMWRIMQQPEPDSFVLATGRTESVRSFVELAFKSIGIAIDWIGENESEIGVCKASGRTMVSVDPKYYRPAEVELLVGDATKAEKQLGWTASTSLEELSAMMVEADLIRQRESINV